MDSKFLLIGSLILILILSGCTEETPKNKVTEVTPEMLDCEEDTDCIPLPFECHPHSCINKKYNSEFTPPEVCTEIFDCSAAYSAEDCYCSYGTCLNRNLNKKTC